MLAIADTCLLIDWANYRRRNILAELFHAIYVPEQVLDEVKSEGVLSWITTNFASGTFILFTPTGDIINEARRIIDIVAKTPWARKIELPEAICLAAGKILGYVVLTENRGAIMAREILPEYQEVRIYKSIDIIENAMIRGLIKVKDRDDIYRELEIFCEDTKHIFRKDDVYRLIKRVSEGVLREN